MINGQSHQGLRGFVLGRNVRHACSAPYGSFLIYYIENESFLGKQIELLLEGREFIKIEELLSAKVLSDLQNFFAQNQPPLELIKSYSDSLLFEMFKGKIQQIPLREKDDRITKIEQYISQNISSKISLEDVASHIHLSSERARHLFLEQTEIPFSQYLLWKRIKMVIAETMRGGMPFSDVAITYGFSDSSHFNRVFKRMFGISPSLIMKNSKFIQFVYPEV